MMAMGSPRWKSPSTPRTPAGSSDLPRPSALAAPASTAIRPAGFMPAIQRLTERLPEGLGIVLINTAEDEDTVFSFLAETAPELSSLLDRDGLATEAWQPRGLPATYLVGPAGQVRYQALGGRDWDTAPYLEFLERIAAEAGDTDH